MDKKHEKSLKVFFFEFLIRTIIYIVLACIFWTIVLCVSISTGLLIPADQDEKQVRNWEDNAIAATTPLFQEFPADAGYVYIISADNYQVHNLTDAEVTPALELYASGSESVYSIENKSYYESIHIGEETIISVYKMKARFGNGVIAELFPNVEIIILVSLVLFILASVTLSIYCTAGKMKKDIIKMQIAVNELKDKNLDFQVTWTSIKELNEVLKVLEELKNNFAQSLQSQWKLEQEKSTQMSALAHDIKTPLTVITGDAQLLSECNLNEEENEYAISICHNAERIQKYVAQIIELSKQDELCINNMESIKTMDFFEELHKDAISMGKVKNTQVIYTSGTLPDSIVIDSEKMHRVFINILSNAIDYCPEKGIIKIDVNSNESYIECTIEDNGKGFTQEALLYATDQFYQADKSRGSKNHYGMGLYIAKQILDKNKGEIILSNSDEGGAKVLVRFHI